MRKVILGTNIAETSLTIPGVKFVIDPGLVKSRGFNAKTGIDSLQVGLFFDAICLFSFQNDIACVQ